MVTRTVVVTDDEAGVRLDRWLRRRCPGATQGRLERLLRTGRIRVDGGRAKASMRLAPGQRVRIPPLDGAEAGAAMGTGSSPPPQEPVADQALLARLQALVIHRDADVVALNKPPGLAVQGGTGLRRHVDALLDGLAFDAGERPRLVHRLDKDTSGVLLLGRSARAAAHLAASFRRGLARKTYWAIVAGVPERPRGRIDLAMGKRRAPGVGERVMPDPTGGKRAVTEYELLERAGRRAAWLALRPLTGRTHQLRVHCAALGTPILGDRKYGGGRAVIDGVPGAGRLKLHAREIAMPHPSGGSLEIAARLPEAARDTWRFFGFHAE